MRGHIVRRKYKNRDGEIVESPNYSLVIELDRDPVTGKRKQQWITVRGGHKEAETRLTEILHQLDKGTYAKPQKQTLAAYLAEWLSSVNGNLSPRTVEGYEQIIGRLPASLTGIPLTRLKPSDLQRYYSESLSAGRFDGRGGLSPLTVRHHHTLLHRALKMALEWGLISRNPADAAHPPTARAKTISVMSESEVQAFLEAARNTGYYSLFFTFLFSGMRRSEALAIRWCDVDLLGCTISVTRSIHRLRSGKYVYQPPKSAKGRREIALSPALVQVLREHQGKTLTERMMIDTPMNTTDLVFSGLDGSPIRPDTVSRAWSDLAKKCGIAAHRLHDGRHTHASLMLKQGVHPRIVQERLGHSTISVTLDVYSHVVPGLQEAAALRFDEVLKARHNDYASHKTR